MPIGLPHIAAFWDNAVAKCPNATALVYEGMALTYAEADEIVARLAGYLGDVAGVGRGDRVCLALPNCPEFILAYWATLRLGAVVAPVNTRLRADELQYVLKNCGPTVVVVHEETAAATEAALAAEGLSPHVLVAGVSLPSPSSAGFQPAANRGGLEALSTVTGFGLADGSPIDWGGLGARTTDEGIAPDDLAVILHTSGTTGVPKGAMMRHCDLLFNIWNAILAHSFRHEDRHLLVIPCFAPTASYSLLASCAYLAAAIVIAPRPQPGEVLDLLERQRCTTFIGVPTLFHLVLQEPRLSEADLSSLRLIAYSGSPMPTRTIRLLRERFPAVSLHNFFGLTETISITHVLPSADAIERADSIGKLMPEVYAKIVDENGVELPTGETGELCLRRDNVIPGYWNRPGLLDEAIRDGWFHTGDLARVDEQGYFTVQGRKKEMIIVAGQNVYAHEVELVVLQHDGVREVAVVGIAATGARAALGELVKAVIVCQPDVTLRELDIKRHCAALLPSYKVPQVVEFRDELPRNAAGKVLKRELG
jgi:acyl-CoA synthetase (AMP-forming)/AMP-acid ligase II